MDKISHGLLDCVPRFLLDDRNAYALARTMDVLLRKLLDDIERADDCLTNPGKMPEWALDEYAYNNGLVWYDKSADVEIKRRWVAEAHKIRNYIGTKEAIRYLLLGIYDSCDVEENWEYGGEPFQFRVTVSGRWDKHGDEWTRKVVESVKNLRSTFEELSVGSTDRIEIRARGEAVTYIRFPICGDMLCGEWPEM